jgi:sec-independent protein translocase protein TatA
MITQLLTPTHLMILLIVLLLLFGPRRLPQTGRALGRSIREFTEAVTGHDGVRRTSCLAQDATVARPEPLHMTGPERLRDDSRLERRLPCQRSPTAATPPHRG